MTNDDASGPADLSPEEAAFGHVGPRRSVDDEDDTVDSIDDAAVERADTGRDTFRPVSVDDRFRKTVRDDHAPNAALHAALKAAAEDDDRIHTVNLVASHAPGNTHKGTPQYQVDVDVRNDGMGHPVLGATVAGRMVDRGDVRIIDVAECSDDHLVVCLRPIETRVEPIDVPVDDIPDDVFEDRVDTITERVPGRPPVEPLREWVEDRDHLFANDPDPDTVAELIADAVAYAKAPDDAASYRDPTSEDIGPADDLVGALESLAAEYDDFSDGKNDAWSKVASDIRVTLDTFDADTDDGGDE